MKQFQILTAKVQLDGGETIVMRGRDAWALLELKVANDNGCTPIDHPGARWSGYVHKLRKAGIVIETIREAHGGPFSGQHGRYLLRSLVTILKERRASCDGDCWPRNRHRLGFGPARSP